MPFSMPMWPLAFGAPVHALPAAAPGPARQRWVIADETVCREVDESEYAAALASCSRVEVARDPHDGVVTTVCHRAL
jgi:hypothetical protein